MNTISTTPQNIFFDSYCYKEPFRLKNNSSLVKTFSNLGIIVRVDPSCREACACFNNLIEFSYFRSVLNFFNQHCFKVRFSTENNYHLIEKLSESDVMVMIDKERRHACAYFDNKDSANELKYLLGVA